MKSSNGIMENLGPCISMCTIIVSVGPLITPYYLFWFVFFVSLLIAALETFNRYTKRLKDSQNYFIPHEIKADGKKNKANKKKTSDTKMEKDVGSEKIISRRVAEKHIQKTRIASPNHVDGFYSGRFAKIVSKVRRHPDRRSVEVSCDGAVVEGNMKKYRSMINLVSKPSTDHTVSTRARFRSQGSDNSEYQANPTEKEVLV